MKKTGYVIAKNKGLSEFFTSSSAYDRPRWVSVNEATTYPTAELADLASKKLYKSSGAYEARVVPVQNLTEARGRDMSYTEQPYDDSDPEGVMPDGGVGDEMDAAGNDKMIAKDQGSDPSIDPEADGEIGLADEEHPDDAEDVGDIEDMVDRQLGDEDMVDDEGMPLDDGTVGMPGEDDEIEGAPEAGFDDQPIEGEETARLHPEEVRMMRRDRGVTESATLPKKPAADAKPAENSTTANKMKAAPEIKYKDSANVADKPDTDLTTTGSQAHEDKIKVPANIKSELKAAIAEFEKAAKFANTRDDAKASFCMTVAEAFKELLDYLELGTVESMKLAQVHMMSWMNPITNHLPTAVQKFVMMGGRKPTLKDLFDSKREDKKGV